MSLVTRSKLELEERAAALNASFAGLSAQHMLDRLLNGGVAGRVAVISSFGAEAAVLLKLVADKAPATPIVSLDTRRHFPETLQYVDDLKIGRAHVWTPVTNAHLVCRLLLEKKKKQ